MAGRGRQPEQALLITFQHVQARRSKLTSRPQCCCTPPARGSLMTIHRGPCRRRSPGRGGYRSALPASSGTAKLPSTPPPAPASSLLLLVPARRQAPSQLPPPGGVAGSTPWVGAEGCDGGAAVAAWQSGIAGGMHALSGSAKTSQLAWHAGAPSQVSQAAQPTAALVATAQATPIAHTAAAAMSRAAEGSGRASVVTGPLQQERRERAGSASVSACGSSGQGR